MLDKLVSLLKMPGALSLAALGAILATLLTAGVYHSQLQTQAIEFQTKYGQALANTAAEQAIDGAINQDLVSLQVILSNIVNNPRVVGATIHDVESLLMVQAGNPPKSPYSESAFSAPITLDDEVAGILTVFVQQEKSGSTPFWYLTFSLSVLTALVLAGLRWQPPWSPATTGKSAEHDNPTEEIAPTPDDAIPDEENGTAPVHPVLLSLGCNNLAQLSQQLSSEAHQQILQDFYTNLKNICHLYSGELKTQEDGRLSIFFAGQETENNILSAVCSAQLILALNQQCSGLRLKLCTRISQTQDEPVLQQLEHTLSGQSELLAGRHYPLLIQENLLQPYMQEKMRWESSDIVGQAEITAIMQPYQKLLENQLQQLSHHTANKLDEDTNP